MCARCLLRFAGHTTFEDYALQSPPGPALLEALHAASRQQGQQPPAPAAPAAASACGASTCPLCMGLLGALLDEHPAATPPAPTPSEPMPQAAAAAAPAGGAAAAAAAADGTATAEAVTAAAPAAAGAGAVDAVWLRIQARAVPGAGGGRAGGGGGGGGKPGPAADHEPLAEAALAAVVAAVRRQAVEGPPDDIRDRLAAVAATGAAAVAAQGGDGDGDVAMGEGAPAPAAAVVAEQEAAQQQGQEAAAPQSVDLAGLPLGPQLPFDSFVVEVPAVPASNAVRDHALHARLMSLYGKQGMYGGWRFEDVTPLATVLRCGRRQHLLWPTRPWPLHPPVHPQRGCASGFMRHEPLPRGHSILMDKVMPPSVCKCGTLHGRPRDHPSTPQMPAGAPCRWCCRGSWASRAWGHRWRTWWCRCAAWTARTAWRTCG